MLYIENEEEYDQLIEDYDDKGWNEKIDYSKNYSYPRTLINSTSNDDQRELRRVKTPIEPSEELKGGQREGLRTSGSYSIESLRNYQKAI